MIFNKVLKFYFVKHKIKGKNKKMIFENRSNKSVL